jgi:cell division protein FtsW
VKPLGISFQPSELARLALIIYLAYSMSKKRDKIKAFSIGFLPHVIVFGCFTLLILQQPDFGMVAIIGFIVWIMMFVGGVRVTYLVGSLTVLLPLAYYILIHESYRLRRLTSFMDPWQHQSDAGYQIVHSLMAFGSGGILGTGIGNSYQKLFYLPEPHTDFIFSVAGEELGLIGVCIVMSLYAVILWRGIIVALRTEDTFGCLLAAGITAAFGLQVWINISVAMGLLPTKGLTLPFLSYGGTSMVVNAVAIGILMNISARRGNGKSSGFQRRWRYVRKRATAQR